MKCSVFIATSVDGFIAKNDGNVDWLHTAGNLEADMGEHADMGMTEYMASVDCMIIGRKCMEMISSMNLTAEQWPYGDTRIIVLSNTLKYAPDNIKDKVELYSGDLNTLISRLETEGHRHAYIDGGTTIQAFINLQLINEMTITRAPVLLGEGIALFGKTFKDIKLEQAQAIAYPNGFVQEKYRVNYL
ncbi:dihydrofolate reductase family protein [Shewanella eurypsychrophilus]|uniref:Dihydrofolate reductase family protein n=1 Tax=Shewanella eurypsychrophilus TaxID=2593656 RepID=A0ABX6V9E3_9GAMM|nr:MULTISPECIES: dihydrofolate reductase family protein [Shewanella]QFU23187.1 dihydrofolate reductase [Shewanella sp. YLB-09]QPG58470.1 dihydrofolate reductase family protein [Shewanella eurypsychrophilus]